MKKLKSKALFVLPIIAIFGVLLCLVGVKNGTFNVITSSIKSFFEGNEEELIKEAAKRSGFEDVNLYEAVVDAYNKEHEAMGAMSYLGGFSGTVTNENNKIVFSNGEVAYYDADVTVGRNEAGNRVGVIITAPEVLNYENYKNASITRTMYYSDGTTEVKEMIFDNVKDSKTHFESWPLVKENLIKVEMEIKWVDDVSQVFVMEFMEGVTLEANNMTPVEGEDTEVIEEETNGEGITTEETNNENQNSSNENEILPINVDETIKGTLSFIGGFKGVTNTNGDVITLEDGVVSYYGSDTTVGRNAPGNRIGIRIDAPQDLKYEDYRDAHIVRTHYYGEKKASYEMTFDSVKDSESHYESWPVVSTDLTKIEINIAWTDTIGQTFVIDFTGELTLEKLPYKIDYKKGLSHKYLETIKSVDAKGRGITSIKGLEQLTSLENIDLGDNSLTSVDLSSNKKLVSLNLNGNKFSKDIVLYDGTTEINVENYEVPVVLPEGIKVELLSNATIDNNFLASFGLKGETEEDDKVIYGVSYNVTSYKYENEGYNFAGDTIYQVNKEFVLDSTNPELSEINLEDAILKVEENKLNIYDKLNNVKIKSFDLLNIVIKSEKYPKIEELPESLAVGFDTISTNDITGNIEVSIVDDVLTLKYGEIFSKDIKILKSSISSSKYNLDKDYIYVGMEEFDASAIDVVNAYLDVYGLNELKVYSDEAKTNEIKSFDIVSIKLTENSNVRFVNDVIYAENYDLTNELLLDNIMVTNARAEMQGTKVQVLRGEDNEIVGTVDVVSLKTNFDLSKVYVYVNNEDVLSKVIVMPENVLEITEMEGTLVAKLGDTKLFSKKILKLSSNDYVITKDYVFTGVESLDISKIASDEELITEVTDNKLVVSYMDEVLDELDIKTITSEVYDLSNSYIDQEFSLEKVSYPEFVTVTEDSENNTVTFTYNDRVYTYYLVKVTNPYFIKDGNIYSKLNETFDANKVVYTNGIVEVQENNKLVIKYGEKEIVYNIVEPKYDITYENKGADYLYVGNDSNEEIMNHVTVNSASAVIRDDTLVIVTEAGEEVSLPIYRISSDIYDLDKPYIYVGLGEFTNDIVGSHEGMVSVIDNVVTVTVKDMVVDTYKVVKVNINDYDINGNDIYTGFNDLDINNVIVSNASREVLNNELVITFGDETRRFNIKKTNLSSTKYDLSKNYIYVGMNDFDIDAIKIENGYLELNNLNELRVYQDEAKTKYLNKKYDIIKISMVDGAEAQYVDGYVYLENTVLNDSNMQNNILGSNATLKLVDNAIKVFYAGAYLENVSIPVVSLTTKYDLSKDYIYVKGNVDVISNFSVLPNNLIEISEDGNVLKAKMGNTQIFSKKLLKLNSSVYDVTDDYVFTGIENLDLSKLSKSEELTVNKKGNNLIVTYGDKEFTDNIAIKTITSDVYDLNNNYIKLGDKEFNLSNINYDKNIISVTNENNIVTFSYKDKKYIYYLVKGNNPYVIKDGNIYAKMNTKFDVSLIKYTNSVVKIENNKLVITIGNEVNAYNIVEPSYSIPYQYGKDYVYVGTDKEASKVVLKNAKKEVTDGRLTITSDSGEVASYPLYYIYSDKYASYLDKDYIYTGVNELNINDVSGNREDMINITDNMLNIQVADKVVKSYKIVQISSKNNKYNLEKKNIYTGFNDFDRNNIVVINGTSLLSSDMTKLNIMYNNEVVDTYNVLKSSMKNVNNNYVVKNNYIYTGNAKFNKDDIKLVNAKSEVKDNQLIISNEEGILTSYDIVTIVKAPDMSKGFIYTEFDDFKISDVDVTNGSVSIDNNYLVIKYNDDLLVKVPIVTIKSNINLKDGYVYTKLDNFYLNKVTVINGIKKIVNNQLLIMYNDVVLKTIDLAKINLGNLSVRASNIVIKEQMDYKDFIANVTCTKATCEVVSKGKVVNSGTIENDMSLIVKYNNKEVDKYPIIVDYLELTNISTDEGKGFINSFRIGSVVSDLVSNVLTSGKVSVTNLKNEIVNSSEKLATGHKVKIELNDKVVTYTVVVKGDVSGDGEIDVYDVGLLYRSVVQKGGLEDCYIEAGDIVGDKDGVDVYDVGMLYRYVVKKASNLEVGE